jgi:hypothetical protein
MILISALFLADSIGTLRIAALHWLTDNSCCVVIGIPATATEPEHPLIKQIARHPAGHYNSRKFN